MVFGVAVTETIKIFAYGSLLNESSLRKTVPEARHVFPARVSGYKRIFNLASHYRYCSGRGKPVCVLNLAVASGQTTMNGVCFEMSYQSYDALISREKIYEIHDVQVADYSDSTIIHAAKLFWAKDFQPYSYLRGSEAQRHYLNLCLTGCGVYGQQFVEDFKMTTEFWNIESDQDKTKIWRGVY